MAGSILKILRSAVLGNRPASRAYGEPYVNFAENQFGVINSSGGAVDLLGVPIFVTTKAYAVGNPVNYGGNLYICTTATTAGVAFTPSQWNLVATQAYVATQIPTSPIPSGTVMSFFQAAAPTGWTQVTTQNDKLLRVVSGTGGVSGGTNAFSTVNAQTATGSHTLSTAEIPAVGASGVNNLSVYPGGVQGYLLPMSTNNSYGFQGAQVSGTGGSYFAAAVYNANPVSYSGASGASNTISVTTGGGGGAHTHPVTMSIQYIDLILASKN